MFVGSSSTAFSYRYVASFQRPFCATLMPKSTCDFASDRLSASAAAENADTKTASAMARATIRARILMGVDSTIVTRPKHRKRFPERRGHGRIESQQWAYHAI